MKSGLLAFLLLFAVSVARADDLADAKAAFATLQEYQRTDDARSLDLFTKDCAVTFTIVSGKESREVPMPAEAFRKSIKDQLALKRGNKDTYEETRFAQEGAAVKVTSTIRYADSGKRGPFIVTYVRENGVLKIKKMQVTAFLPDPQA